MNKYDKKILKIAPDNCTIHELIRRPVRSPFFHYMNIILDNIPWMGDGFTSKGAYYLVINETKGDLAHIERNLDVSHKDVTNAVQISADKRAFEFEGNRYKLHRKIK